jgi:subtilisin family serine protease
MEGSSADPLGGRQPNPKLDPYLNYELVELERTRATPETDLDPVQAARPVGVWVRFTGDLDEAIHAGLQVGVVAGNLATGTIAVGDLEQVAACSDVVSVSATQEYHEHLNNSVPAIHADHGSVAPVGGGSGTGVIVGIFDTGIDIFHHNFRNADGTTRILRLLDLTLRQTISITGDPTGGTFTLSWAGSAMKRLDPAVTTGAIAYNAAAADVQAALVGMPGGIITAGDIAVAGGPLPGTPVTVDFIGQYAGQEVTRLWAVSSLTGGSAPKIAITRGREFTDVEINDALAHPDQGFLSVDTVGHGSHVAGIAAGNGLQPGVDPTGLCHGAGTYVGVAPAASLIIVKRTRKGSEAMPDPMVTGVSYIFTQAVALGASQPIPAVVNISIGGSHGAHDGTDAEELALNSLLQDQAGQAIPGRAIVVSAGNDGGLFDPDNPNNQDVGRHAATEVPPNGQATISFEIRAKDTSDERIDIWYSGTARLQATFTPPDGWKADPGGPVLPPADADHPTHRKLAFAANTAGRPAAASADVFSYINRPPTNWPGHSDLREKHEIHLRLQPPPLANPQPPGTEPQRLPIANGTWKITLSDIAGASASVDAWMAFDRDKLRKGQQPMFAAADQVRLRSLTIPGTAANLITVGNYDYRTNTLSNDSSRGPTLDTTPYQILKPDLCAPGEKIASAKSSARNTGSWCDCCYDFYVDMSGTSMAAPHVTGIVALVLEKNAQLGYDDIRRFLLQGCQPPDPITGPTLPNADWGAGIVDGAQTLAHVVAAPHATVRSLPERGIPAPRAAAAAWPINTAGLHRLSALVSGASADPAGSVLAALVSTHFDEVKRLINSNRRILIVWHRMGGPQLMREAMHSKEHPVRLAAEASGRPMSEWLDRLLELLHEYGSPALREDVVRYRPLVFELAGALLDDPAERRQAG